MNCGVDLARLTSADVIVDLKPGLGEVALFLGVRSRYTLLDALDNLHRLDREFLRELVVKHKSGLEILAGSDRSIVRAQDAPASKRCSGCSAASTTTSSSTPAADRSVRGDGVLHRRHDLPGGQPRRAVGAQRAAPARSRPPARAPAEERVRLLLNRAAEPYPIPPDRSRARSATRSHHMFPSDYKTVSTALNSGVPLALSGNTDIATQFDRFTRRSIDPSTGDVSSGRARSLGLQRLASMW